MTSDRVRAAAAIALLVALGVLALARPASSAPIPPRVPADRCEPWMADCLPGVGAKRRDAAVEAIRSGRDEALPTAARAAAAEWFLATP